MAQVLYDEVGKDFKNSDVPREFGTEVLEHFAGYFMTAADHIEENSLNDAVRIRNLIPTACNYAHEKYGWDNFEEPEEQ